MAEQGSVTTSFSAGQTPIRMRGRYDHPLYLNGAEQLTNVIPTPGGTLIRRPGTETIVAAGTIDESSRMIDFQDQENNGALLIFAPNESGTANLRVYQNDTLVKTLSHSYVNGAVDINALDYVQVRDYMFFVHRNYAPKMFVKSRTATFTGDGSTTIFDFPFAVPDTSDISVEVDDVVQTGGGTDYTLSTFDQVDGQFIGVRITFTSAPGNGDVIEIIRDWGFYDYPNLDGPWEPENTDVTKKIAISAIATDESANGDGHFGACTINAVAKKGASKAWMNDSWVGRSLRVYSNDGGSPAAEQYATVSIDSISTTKTTYGGTVSEEYPMASEAGAAPFSPRTARWSLSAWYEDQYPEVVGVHQDSLWFGRDTDRWKTVTGSLFRFSPSLPDDDEVYLVTEDSGISITGTDPIASKPTWLYGDKVLFSATDTSQMVIQGGSLFSAVTPSTVSLVKQNTIGAAKIKPVAMNDLYFVDNLKQNIYSLDYQFQRSSYVAEKMNKFDDQLFYKRIRKIVLINYPFTMLWALMEDESVVNITVNEIDGTYAPSVLNGFGCIDLAVLRQSDGSEAIYSLDNNGVLLKFATFGTYEGDARTTLNILNDNFASTDYYITFGATTDRELYTDYATKYSGGASIDLNTIGASKVVVDDENYTNWAYSDTSKTVTPDNDYEVGTPFYVTIKTNQIFTTQGTLTDANRRRKLVDVKANLYKTLDFKVKEVSASDYEDVKIREYLSNLTASYSTFTGLKNLGVRGSKQTTLQLEITQDLCLPFTLNSLIYEYEI